MDPPTTGNPQPSPSNPSARADPSAENLSGPIATRVETTQVERTSSTRWPLESYAPNFARARKAWSAATEKAAQDGQKKAKEAYEAKSQAVVKKLKGTHLFICPE